MIRRSLGGAILGFALLVGSFAWSGFAALQTVFDPDRSREVAEELLDNEEVRVQLAENLAGAIGALIPPEVPVEQGLVDQVTTGLLNDPTVEATILAAFTDTHRAFLGEGDVPGQVDLSPVAAVARQNLIAAAPQLDTVVPESPPLTVPLPTDRVPNAGPVRSFLETAVPILAAVAAFGAILALVATNDRPSILRRAGTWAVTTTAIYLILGLGVPYLLRQYAPDQAEVVAALLSALLRSLLVPSIALAASGLALFGIAAAWPSGERRRAAAERRAPYPDAPHRREVAEMDTRRRSRVIGREQPPRPQPQPRARPAVHEPPVTYAPPTQSQPRVPTPGPQGPATPARPAAQPTPPPYPDGPPPGSPLDPPRPAVSSPHLDGPPPGSPLDPPGPAVSSPYPDDAHYRATHPEGQWEGLGPPTNSGPPIPPAPEPSGAPTNASVFADVPRPSEPTGLPADAQPVEPGRSVFESPAAPPAPSVPPAPRPAPARPSSPPVGARWNARHGWILDPDSPDPLPAGAIWVDGVGYVLPEPGQR